MKIIIEKVAEEKTAVWIEADGEITPFIDFTHDGEDVSIHPRFQETQPLSILELSQIISMVGLYINRAATETVREKSQTTSRPIISVLDMIFGPATI